MPEDREECLPELDEDIMDNIFANLDNLEDLFEGGLDEPDPSDEVEAPGEVPE